MDASCYKQCRNFVHKDNNIYSSDIHIIRIIEADFFRKLKMNMTALTTSSRKKPYMLMALALAMKKKKKQKRRKRFWAKECLVKRSNFNHDYFINELKISSPWDFRNFLRMDIDAFDQLLGWISPYIQKKDTIMREAIQPEQRLLITLRYLATGDSLEELRATSAISAPSIGNIVMETTEAIIKCLKNYIREPKTPEDWEKISDGFYETWNFPNCMGAIDGIHVAIKNSTKLGIMYPNYKKIYSLVLLGVVNANYEFIMVDIGDNDENNSDIGVFSNSEFGQAFLKNKLNLPEQKTLPFSANKLPFVLVADDAFQLSENMMVPYDYEELTDEQLIFNYRLRRARCVVENAFGILVTRFGALQRTISLSPPKAKNVLLACCYLHNYLRNRVGQKYLPLGSIDAEDTNTGTILPGLWRNKVAVTPLQGLYSTIDTNDIIGEITRDNYCNYFNYEYELPWQDKFEL